MGIDKIIQIAHVICPSNRDAPALALEQPLVGDGCMSPEQKQKLQRRMGKISGALNGVSKALEIAAFTQQEPRKSQLNNIAQVIDIVNQDLIANITTIVDSVCGTCSEIWPSWRQSKWGK